MPAELHRKKGKNPKAFRIASVKKQTEGSAKNFLPAIDFKASEQNQDFIG